MDKDYTSPEHIGLDSKPQTVKDKVDLAHEIMGESGNRIRRFLSNDGVDFNGETKEKKQERRYLNRLQTLLLDAEYKAAYDAAIRALNQTQSAVYDALIGSIETLRDAKASHNALLEKASTLPDGTRVFLDDDGKAYTEQGRALTEEEFVQVDWKENSPSREAFKKSRDTLKSAQERHDMLQKHTTRLEEIEQELKSPESPPSQERVEELHEEMQQMATAIDADTKQDNTLVLASSVHLPELKL